MNRCLATAGRAIAVALVLSLTAACREAVITTEPDLKAGGTIAGFVRASDGSTPLVSRTVTAINSQTGVRFQTTTGVNGGYTIKVPDQGKYRLEVELRDGEIVARGPQDTDVNNGDLDPGRDFEITVKPAR